MLLFCQIVLFFVSYSFLAWIWEIIFHLAMHGKVFLQRFMTMPLLPIYGFGALGIIYLVEPYVHNPFLVLMAVMLIATGLELVVSFVLDYFFKLRLWDYSEWPMNFRGYVCLPAALGFGALGLLVVYVLHPWLGALIGSISLTAAVVLGWTLFVLVSVDFLNSFISLVRLRFELTKLQGTLDDVQGYIDNLIRDLRAERRKLRATAISWYRYNLRRFRKAFPAARVSLRTMRQRKSGVEKSSLEQKK